MDKTAVPLSESITTSTGHNIQGTGLLHKHAHAVDVTLQARDERFEDNLLRCNGGARGMQWAGCDAMGGACGMQQAGRMGCDGGVHGMQWRGTWDATAGHVGHDGGARGMQWAGHVGHNGWGSWDATGGVCGTRWVGHVGRDGWGVWDTTGRACGTRQAGHMGCDGWGTWGAMVSEKVGRGEQGGGGNFLCGHGMM